MGHGKQKKLDKRAEDRRVRQGQRRAANIARRAGRDSGSFSETGDISGGESGLGRWDTLKNTARQNFADFKSQGPSYLEGASMLVPGGMIGNVGKGLVARGTILNSSGRIARAGIKSPKVKTALGGVGIATAGAVLADQFGESGYRPTFNIPIPKINLRRSNVHKGAGQSIRSLPGVGGMLPNKDMVVKTWNTGTAQFARLADGRMAVQKKDGTIKTWRPAKHIVIPRNPRVATLLRAEKRIDRLAKGLRKMVRTGKR